MSDVASHITRASMLLSQGRCELAERELRQALAQAPGNAYAASLLALCLGEQKKHAEAEEAAAAAVAAEPGAAFAHNAVAAVAYRRSDYARAKTAIDEAIRLDPDDAHNWGLLSAILLATDRTQEALKAADQGLQVDAEDEQCSNLRAMALTKLRRRTEAAATVEGVLSRNPENATTHANLGWTRLHQARHREALEHFREALRLDPDLEWARIGMMEALKARYIVYRLMLRYFLWVGTLGKRGAWVVLIGVFLLFRALRAAAENAPQWRLVIVPLLVLCGLFILLTWTARPLFNSMLRLNRFGRMVLSPGERQESTWFLILIGAAAASALPGLLYGIGWLVALSIVCTIMIIPVTHTLHIDREHRPWWMIVVTAVMAACGAGAVAAVATDTGSLFLLFALPGLAAFLGFQIAANVHAIHGKPRVAR